MSYLVCHVQKIKAGGIKGMQLHNQRESKNLKNPDINPDKSNLNYDLKNPENINFLGKYKDIIKSEYTGSKAIRKDAVAMCSVLVTSDHAYFAQLPKYQQDQFFREAYDFLKTRYGENNVIAAAVHLDETTPHMHFDFVPIRDGKLTAKTIFDAKGLRSLQDDIHKHLAVKCGFDLQRGESDADRQHIPIHEFKQQTIEALEIKAKRLSQEITGMEKKIMAMQRIDDLQITLQPSVQKSVFGKETVSKEDYDKLHDTVKDMAKSLETLKVKYKSDMQQLGEYKKIINGLEKGDIYKGLQKDLARKSKKIGQLRLDLEGTKKSLKQLQRVSGAMEQVLVKNNLMGMVAKSLSKSVISRER